MSGSDVSPIYNVFERKSGDVITFAQFEKGNILTEICNDAESGGESNNESIMMS